MSRAAQIHFLSRTASLYDPVVRALRFPALWDAVAELAEPAAGEDCLDVCTGSGGVALALARGGARALGLDLAEGLLARARSKSRRAALAHRTCFLRADARALPFASGSFPLVTCSMALHEMGEEERAIVLRELRRVSRGRVIVADYRVPRSRLGGTLFRLAHAFEYLESDDFAGFTARDLVHRLEDAGLAVEARADCGPYGIWRCRAAPGSRP